MEKLKNSKNKFLKLLFKIIEKNEKYELSNSSAIITYYLLLSIGPFLVLMFSLLSFFLTDNISAVYDFVNSIYSEASIIIDPILKYLSESQSSTFALIGLLATLFSSSKSSKQIINSFNKIFKNEKKTGIKNIFMSNIYSMLFTIALVVSIIIFFVFFVTGDPIAAIVEYFFNMDLSKFALWNFLRLFLPIIYLVVFVTSIFKLFSNIGDRDNISLFEAFIGASFVSVGWIIGSGLFSFYIKNFNKNNAIYGALGSIMIIMIWFYLLIYMLLLGAAFIVSYIELKQEEKEN